MNDSSHHSNGESHELREHCFKMNFSNEMLEELTETNSKCVKNRLWRRASRKIMKMKWKVFEIFGWRSREKYTKAGGDCTRVWFSALVRFSILVNFHDFFSRFLLFSRKITYLDFSCGCARKRLIDGLQIEDWRSDFGLIESRMASPSKKIVHMDTASDLKLRDMQYKDKMSLLNKNFLQVSRKIVQTCSA